MKIATKTLVTMLVITMLALGSVPAVSAMSTGMNSGAVKQLDRLQQHHDRKLELRASLLGITPDQLKMELKTKSFNQILKEHGFSTKQAYYKALLGKVKQELRNRGWDDRRIQQFLNKRAEKVQGKQKEPVA